MVQKRERESKQAKPPHPFLAFHVREAHAMGIISWIVFGFIIGLIARAVVPGKQSMGFIMTTLLGVGGSLVGGFVASAISGRSVGEIHGAGIVGSLIGAVLLLVIAGAAMGSRRRLA